MNDPHAATRAKELARLTLSGELDPLLASRDLVTLRTCLPDVPASVWDVFTAVASETDGLPIGDERRHWAPERLRVKDLEAADYRTRVKASVMTTLQELLAALE